MVIEFDSKFKIGDMVYGIGFEPLEEKNRLHKVFRNGGKKFKIAGIQCQRDNKGEDRIFYIGNDKCRYDEHHVFKTKKEAEIEITRFNSLK